MARRWFQGILILAAFLFVSCSPARHMPDDKYLLSRNRVTSEQKSIPESQLKSYLLQKPNKRVIGTRFFLFLHNLSNLEKEKWPHGWLRKIGEEPVVYDETLTRNSTAQLRQFLENKGYYNNEVSDTTTYKRRNARVNYSISLNRPYKVRKIRYTSEDTAILSRILADTLNSLVRRGIRFDKDQLQQERIRIETLLKEQGFFNFSKEYIFYDAVTDPESYAVDLVMHVKEYIEGDPDPRTKIRLHPRYRISKVFMHPDYTDQAAISFVDAGKRITDTVQYDGLFFLNPLKPRIKPGILAANNDIVPGDYYRLSDVTRTYRNLSELGIIRYTNITFREKDTLPAFGTDRYLDCNIELTQKKLQSFQTELAGTNSSGDLGIRGNLLYQHLNLFRGAQVFNFKLTGAIESLKIRTDGQYSSMKEIGAESNILFPQFFSPLRFRKFVTKYAPKTSISLSFNYQSRHDYTRSIANSSFSYRWKGSPHITHTVWPLEFSYVQIYEKYSQSEFLDSIRDTPLGYSFEDHVVNVARYGFELNNQAIGKSKDFIYTRVNLESAGNIPFLVNTRVIDTEDTGEPFELFKVPYFQYVRGDIDFRYYNVIDKQNRFAYRLFVGVGYPYGNSETLPYEKKYFAGGANSLRAWSTRELGPGSYVDPTPADSFLFYFPNQNGDIKLEFNAEYRFKVFWKMESALFFDIGNVWLIKKDEDKPNAEFDFNRFYKEIAVGSGIGFRFDFSFFLLRIDLGIKLRDPARTEEEGRWIPFFKDFRLHPKFGIGYPF